MTGESESSHGIRRRNNRNRASGNIDIKDLEAEPMPTEDVDGTSTIKSNETFDSGAESLSSENTKREEHLDDARAVALREAVLGALQRDELLRRKRKTRVPQICISVLGMICLGWPSLLLFDLVLIFLPFDHVEALQYSSQETSFVGFASRLCLKIVKIARTAQITNTEYHGAITFACLAFLACLLYVVRVTTRIHKAMTHAERQTLQQMVEGLGKTPPSDAKQKTDCAPPLE